MAHDFVAVAHYFLVENIILIETLSLRISGGDILFDGERFWPKPVEAITIALWVKLDTNKGIQSIFDTVGQKFSNHKEGQYHVEIENGKIRWFHRNEKHTVVFSIMSQPLVSEGLWHHIAGTYDAQKSIAKVRYFESLRFSMRVLDKVLFSMLFPVECCKIHELRGLCYSKISHHSCTVKCIVFSQ